MLQSLNDSIRSVVSAFQQPASAQQITDQAIQSDTGLFPHRDVPFVARPPFLFPPVTGRTPGASRPEDFAASFFSSKTGNKSWLAFAQSDRDYGRRAEYAQGSDQVVRAAGKFTTETPFGCAQGRRRHGGIYEHLN